MANTSSILRDFKEFGGLSPQELKAKDEAYVKDRNAAIAPLKQSIEEGAAQRKQILATPVERPQKPYLQALPQAPSQQFRSPAEAMMSGGPILAALGSLFTRRPAVAMMNAFASGTKAFNAGDTQRMQQERQNWKDALDQTVAQNAAELQAYSAALQDANFTMADRQAQLMGIAASNQDQQMLATLTTGSLDASYQLISGRQKAAGELVQLKMQAEQQQRQFAETQRHNRATEAASSGAGGLPSVSNKYDLAQTLVAMDKAGMSGTQEYAAYFNLAAAPEQSYDAASNSMVTKTPDMSMYAKPTWSQVAQSPSAPTTSAPQSSSSSALPPSSIAPTVDMLAKNAAPVVSAAPQGQTTTVSGTGAPASGGISLTQLPGMPKLTESQSNALTYATRIAASNPIIGKFEKQGQDFWQNLGARGPSIISNFLATSEFQQYQQAKEDFLRAVLRKESGAVISPEEMAGGEKQYFPVPGDGPETVAQKSKNRSVIDNTMRFSAGPGAAFVDDLVQNIYGNQSGGFVPADRDDDGDGIIDGTNLPADFQ